MKRKKGFVVLLAEEALGAVGDEVDAVLVLVGDGFAVVVVDGAFVGVRGVLERVGSFP